MTHQPTPGFEFPAELQQSLGNRLGTADAVDDALRKLTDEPSFMARMGVKPTVRLVDEEERPRVVVSPQPATPVTSAEAISLDLPSRFFYYDFKDLYVKPMRTPQLAKLSKAHETGELQTQVEAISSLLSTPSGLTNIAMQLTMADYTAVLYWLRMSSFPKPQMRVTSTCKNEKHVQEVLAGKKDKASLEIQTIVHKTDLRTKYLEQAPDPNHYCKVIDGITIPFGPETLADTIQFLQHDLWTDEEFQFKSRIAAVLKLEKATGKVWTWDQKVQFVDEYMSIEDVLKAQEFADMMDDYGMIETVETKCAGCGSKGITEISCDPVSFLSPKF